VNAGIHQGREAYRFPASNFKMLANLGLRKRQPFRCSMRSSRRRLHSDTDSLLSATYYRRRVFAFSEGAGCSEVSGRLKNFTGADSYSFASSCSGSASGDAADFLARVVVMTTTLTSTSSVPSKVLGPTVSPPRKYPTITATTGFTYA